MPNNNTHALVSAPPRILQDSVRTDEEPTTAEWTSDDARTRNSMESTAFTPLNEQASTVLEPRQAQLKLSLSSSVAQPSPQSVARRSAQTNANHKRIKNKKKRDVEAVQRAPRSPQQHREQTNKNNKTHKIKINKNKKFKRMLQGSSGRNDKNAHEDAVPHIPADMHEESTRALDGGADVSEWCAATGHCLWDVGYGRQ